MEFLFKHFFLYGLKLFVLTSICGCLETHSDHPLLDISQCTHLSQIICQICENSNLKTLVTKRDFLLMANKRFEQLHHLHEILEVFPPRSCSKGVKKKVILVFSCYDSDRCKFFSRAAATGDAILVCHDAVPKTQNCLIERIC